MKNFVNKQFKDDNEQLFLLFLLNIGIIFIGIIFAVIHFKSRIKLFMRNRMLLRLIPDYFISIRNGKIANFICKHTKIKPKSLIKKTSDKL